MIRNPAFSLSLFVGREPRGGVLTGSTCRARQNGITQARRMVRGSTHAQRKGALATCATLKQCTSRNLRNNTRCAPSKARQAACGTPHCFATFPEFGGLADQTKLFPTHLADPTKLFPDAISMFGGSYKIVPQTFPTTFPEGPFQPIFPDGDLADPTKLFPDWRILQNCFPHIWRILQNCFPHIWRIRQNCSPTRFPLADPTKLFPDLAKSTKLFPRRFPQRSPTRFPIWRILQNCSPRIWRIRQNCSPTRFHLADPTKLFPTHLADPTKLFPDGSPPGWHGGPKWQSPFGLPDAKQPRGARKAKDMQCDLHWAHITCLLQDDWRTNACSEGLAHVDHLLHRLRDPFDAFRPANRRIAVDDPKPAPRTNIS
jgi:hypothetical protein